MMGAALALAAALVTAQAGADPLPRLVVVRADDTLDCPDAAALAGAVARQMGRPALDPSTLAPALEVYAVRVTRDGGKFAADILTQGTAGSIRHIDDPGDTCAGLADALALTLAILLDRANDPAPLSPPAWPLPPPPPPAPPLPFPGVAVAAYGVFSAGVLGSPAGAVAGEIEVRPRRSFAAAAGVLGVPAQSYDFPPGEVAISMLSGLLRACGVLGDSRGPRVSLCVEGLGGAISAAGSGFPENATQTRPWFALGAAAVGAGPLMGPLEWTARADLLAPLVHERFDVEGLPGVVYDPAPVGGLLGAGLRLSIR